MTQLAGRWALSCHDPEAVDSEPDSTASLPRGRETGMTFYP